jgi:4-hydroxy-3-polyprenylbenzoate decarboxylase
LSGRRRLVVGITGASGIVYGVRLLEALRDADVETHLVLSRAAVLTIGHELDRSPAEVKALASRVHGHADLAASIASGSFRTAGMIVAPCSMGTLAAIASGVTDNLIARAADVVLKERRRLVLLVRESPLHLGHLRNMAQVTELGGIVAPPVPAFYPRPRTIEDLIDHTVGRVLDLFDIESGLVRRWTEDGEGKTG